MRSEKEILDLILSFAGAHDSIRAMVMNGSRANPNLGKDPFQDYDIACYTTDVSSFVRQPSVPAYFGRIMILQMPNDMHDPPPDHHDSYNYLMQFMDGSRIDLSFNPMESVKKVAEDSLSIVLLDRDNLLSGILPASEKSYLPKRPTRKSFDDCCNEFWWLNPYVAKSLWRGQLTFAKSIMEKYIRAELIKMIVWENAERTRYAVAPGYEEKHLQRLMEPQEWRELLGTYPDARPEGMWDALFAAGRLFRKAAYQVAEHNGFEYPQNDDAAVSEFIEKIRTLPADALDL